MAPRLGAAADAVPTPPTTIAAPISASRRPVTTCFIESPGDAPLRQIEARAAHREQAWGEVSPLPLVERDRPRERPGWGTAAPYPTLTASPSVPPHKGEGGCAPLAPAIPSGEEAGMASAKDIENRKPITAALMLATLMNTLDSTIANV